MAQDFPDEDAQQAYLFHCASEPDLRAISVDPEAGNIATHQCATGWVRDQELRVGVQEALPVALSPEPVLRGLRKDGFFVWREGSNPKSTTQ